MSIPLPSTNEPCEFTLYETNSVKSLLESIKDEDEGVNEALVHSLEGIRISQNTRISSLLSNGFKLKINDEMHTITPSSEGKQKLKCSNISPHISILTYLSCSGCCHCGGFIRRCQRTCGKAIYRP